MHIRRIGRERVALAGRRRGSPLRWLPVFLLITVPALAAPPLPAPPGAERLEALRGLDLDQAFAAVATGVRYEPYRGILRGAAGTALSRAGNAADQALLLADLLRGQGYRVRFARGRLADENLNVLLRGLYPPELPDIDFPAELDPFSLEDVHAAAAAAAEHVWLEVDQGDGSWLPLDPAFPRAVMGEAYAEAEERLDELPDAMEQRLTLVLREQTVGGATRELGRFDAPVAALGQTTLSLAIQGAAQLPAEEEKPASPSPMGGFGAILAGEEPATAAEEQPDASPDPVGTRYRRHLQMGAERITWQSSLVLDADPGSRLQREWLQITVQVPGEAAISVERDLFVADAPGAANDAPAEYRRYALTVLPGAVPTDAVEAFAARVTARLDVPAARERLQRLDRGAESAEGAAEARQLDDEAAPLLGQLMALRFAAESDVLTQRVALGNGVAVTQRIPRVLIASVEGDSESGRYRTALDLRLDQVEAWPFPGHASAAAVRFHEARGLQNTLLEAGVLERIAGERPPAANTGQLMARLPGGMSGLLAVHADQQDALDALPGLSPYARRLVEASLTRGHVVAIPSEPVELAGRPRYGWWDIDPATGRTIGVMDDGLHQALVDHSLASEEIGLHDHTGFTLGMIVGGVATHFRLAAGILEYGEVTEQLIKDIEKTIKDLKCFSCPQVDFKDQVKIQLGDSCWSKSYGIGYTNSGLKFCQAYTNGMSCSAAMILSGLRGKPTAPEWTVTHAIDKKLICEL